MRAILSYIFKSNKNNANTFIGGIGAVTDTAAKLAAKLAGVTEADIKGFKVDGNNNISCEIVRNYTINSQWVGDSTLTWYVDLFGRCTEVLSNTLYSNSNQVAMYLPSVATIGNVGGFRDTNNLGLKDYFYYPNLITTKNSTMYNMGDLKRIILPKLKTMWIQNASRSAWSNLTGLNRLYVPNLTTVYWYYVGISILSNIKQNCKVYVSPVLANVPNYANIRIGAPTSPVIGATITINGLPYVAVASSPSAGEFTTGNPVQTCQSLATAINNDIRIGTLYDVIAHTSSSNIAIVSKVAGPEGNAITIDVGDTTFAINDGNPSNNLRFGETGRHPMIKYIEDTRNCIIQYVDDFSSIDPPTDLEITDITETSIVLNFTPPTPNVNGIEGYEVWVDDGILPYLQVLAHAEVLVSGETIDLTGIVVEGAKLKVRTFDNNYNLSEFSEVSIIRNNNNNNILPLDSIISEYKFENNVIDTVGSNNGTATDITYEDGLVGKRAVFNGSTSIITIPDADDLSFGDGITQLPMSVSLLFKTNAVEINDIILEKASFTSGNLEYLFFIGNDLKIKFQIYSNSVNANKILFETVNAININEVTHLGVCIGSSPLTDGRIYINGVSQQIYATETGNFVAMINTDSDLYIGSRGTGTNELNGTENVLKFWDKQLTSSEWMDLATLELAGIDINP